MNGAGTGTPPRNPCQYLQPPENPIERATEIQTVIDALRDPDVLLVAICGDPYIGKSMVAVRAAYDLCSDFQNGYVQLNMQPQPGKRGLTQPEGLARIAREISGRIPGSGGTVPSTIKELASLVTQNSILLVLEDLDDVQLIPILEAIVLAAAPNIKMIVTSTQNLLFKQVPHRLLTLRPLAYPALPYPGSLADLEATYPAAHFFLQIARQVRQKHGDPDFSAVDAGLVAEICYQLEGINGLLVLAATQLETFTLAELSDQFQQKFRQKSATISAKYDKLLRGSYRRLLNSQQRQGFRRASVFADKFTKDAFLKITNVRNPDEVLRRLSSVRLIERVGGTGSIILYRLRRPIQVFACARMRAEEAMEAEKRHSLYYVNLAEASKKVLQGDDGLLWLERLEAERPNFEAVFERAREQHDVLMELRLANALTTFWDMRGYWREGERRLNDALTSLARLDPDEQDQYPYRRAKATALQERGSLASLRGQHNTAQAFFNESLVIWRDLVDQMELPEDREALAKCLNNLGLDEMNAKQYDKARDRFTESLHLYETLASELRPSRRGQDQATLPHGLPYAIERAGILINRGTVELYTRNYAEARRTYGDGLEILKRVGNVYYQAKVLANQGEAEWQDGNPKMARQYYVDSLRLANQVQDPEAITTALRWIAIADTLIPERPAEVQEWAIRLWGAEQHERQEHELPIPEEERKTYELAVEKARDTLGQRYFHPLWQEGETKDLAEIVAYTLNAPPP